MRRKKLISALVLTTVLIGGVTVFAYSSANREENTKTESTKQTMGEKDMALLFFLNPYGRPCQMQDEILKGMGEKLTGSAELKYVKTTEPNSREAFSKYGIRALPSMVFVDGDGETIKRFPPGIQSESAILDALKAE